MPRWDIPLAIGLFAVAAATATLAIALAPDLQECTAHAPRGVSAAATISEGDSFKRASLAGPARRIALDLCLTSGTLAVGASSDGALRLDFQGVPSHFDATFVNANGTLHVSGNYRAPGDARESVRVDVPRGAILTLRLSTGSSMLQVEAAPGAVETTVRPDALHARLPPGGYVVDATARGGRTFVDVEPAPRGSRAVQVVAYTERGDITIQAE